MLSRSWWLWQSVQSMQRLLWPRRGLELDRSSEPAAMAAARIRLPGPR